MEGALTIGVIIFTSGVVMTIFRRPLRLAFCRFGKWGFSYSPFADLPVLADLVEHVYDEGKAPRDFCCLGVLTSFKA